LLVNHLNLHPGAPTHPSTPEVLQVKERAPTPFPSTVVTFGLVVESIKELGGASLMQHLLVDLKQITRKQHIVLAEL
jgi:hypothetical protein